MNGNRTSQSTDMRRPPLAWALLVLIAVLWGLPARGDDRATSDSARIISCAPNLTEMLFAIGAGDNVIGVTRYCEYPDEAKALPKLGDLFNPNLEAMVAARPTMIVHYPSSAKVKEFFGSRQDVALVETNQCETIAEIQATMRQLGAATGHAAAAERILLATRARLDAIAAESRRTRKPRVLFVVGRDKGGLTNLYAASSGTYVSELLEICGARNVVDASLGKFPVLNRETLLKLNPEIIVETHAEDTLETRAEVARAWGPLKPIDAVRKGKLAILCNPHLMVPGAYLERDAETLRTLLSQWDAPAAYPPGGK